MLFKMHQCLLIIIVLVLLALFLAKPKEGFNDMYSRENIENMMYAHDNVPFGRERGYMY